MAIHRHFNHETLQIDHDKIIIIIIIIIKFTFRSTVYIFCTKVLFDVNFSVFLRHSYCIIVTLVFDIECFIIDTIAILIFIRNM